MKKRKILFLLHLPPPVHGAAMVGQYIRDSKVINETFDCEFLNLSTSKANSEIGKRGLGKFRVFYKTSRGLTKAIINRRPDLCYVTFSTTGLGFFKDLALVRILKKAKLPVVFHFHNKGVKEHQHKWYMDRLYQYAFKNTKAILLSPRLYNDVEKYIQPADVYFCANGIPDEPIDSNQLKNRSDRLNIFFLSNMNIEKGVLVLLESCKILKEKGIDFECHFVGDWTDISEEDFNTYVENAGLYNQVFAHGKQYGDDKIEFFLKADLFTFPTFYPKECFPLVLLEAMKFGLPVISTFEGGIPDMIEEGENGLLVPGKNALALADSITNLAESADKLGKMGAKGRKRFEEEYTMAIFERNLANILASCLG